MARKPGIYGIRNRINNKIYVGSSFDTARRIVVHRHKLNKNIHDNLHLQRAWNKYWNISFEFIILEYCEKDRLIELEQHWINLLKANNEKFGYNIRKQASSNLGHIHTKDAKLKMSNRHKGKPKSEEAIARMKHRILKIESEKLKRMEAEYELKLEVVRQELLIRQELLNKLNKKRGIIYDDTSRTRR